MPDNPRPMTIREILSGPVGRSFFRDFSSPPWLEGRNRLPPMNLAGAEHARELLIKALFRDEGADAVRLARRLMLCSTSRRCLSGACHVCRRAAQLLHVHACRNLFDDLGGEMFFVNLVYADAWIACDELDANDIFAETRRRLVAALNDVGARAVGGFDISENTHESGAFGGYMSPHACLITPRRPIERHWERFKEWFPRDNLTPRPAQHEDFDGYAAGIAYGMKIEFFNRIRTERSLRPDGSRSRHNTRLKPIWGESRVELALALDRAGIDNRHFLHGYDVVVRRGEAGLIRTDFPSRPSRFDRTSRDITRRPSPAA
jgi:hypothetical protein